MLNAQKILRATKKIGNRGEPSSPTSEKEAANKWE